MFNLNFTPLSLSHYSTLLPVLSELSPELSGYTFSSLASWNFMFHYQWAKVCEKGLIITICLPGEPGCGHMLQPLGDFSADCEALLLEQLSMLPYPLRIYGVAEDFIKKYPHFIEHFEITNNPSFANYVYNAEDLALLPGRKYQKKRNLIAQGEKLYTFESMPLETRHVGDCSELLSLIEDEEQIASDQNLQNERKALDYTLTHCMQLNQKGQLIRVDGKLVAFSIWEELNKTTAVVHFEKADRNYKGIYQLINRETSKSIFAQGYKYINREEDLGLEGLRQAKQSYFPVELKSSYYLTFRKK